jgi:hypothetical protein
MLKSMPSLGAFGRVGETSYRLRLDPGIYFSPETLTRRLDDAE